MYQSNVYGCMDDTMFNYNPDANTDNGSCIPFVYGCIDSDYRIMIQMLTQIFLMVI